MSSQGLTSLFFINGLDEKLRYENYLLVPYCKKGILISPFMGYGHSNDFLEIVDVL
tara:strand:+ start:10053 stop:10220 length:168 start_codon:yes stop_codon:yes gene_type:complete